MSTKKCKKEIIVEICDQLMGSDISVEAICKSNPDKYPTYTSFWRAIREAPELQNIYLKAKEIQMHHLAEQLIAIADLKDRQNYREYSDEKLRISAEKNENDRDRLRIDARIKIMSVLNRRTYGNAVDLKLEEMKQALEDIKGKVKEK